MAKIVEAAGGIVYRRRTDFPGWMKFSDSGRPNPATAPESLLENLELCVVHRPKYDDWSWPKGKLEPNESSLHTAVREIGEETGAQVSLGPLLGEVTYQLADEGARLRREHGEGPVKHVVFWMATLLDTQVATRRRIAFGPIHRPDTGEIDHAAWVGVERARQLLTHSSDQDVLSLFVDRIRQRAADSVPILIVRHSKAEARKTWIGAENERPLTPRGAGAAYALTRELACFAPARILTSPWKRCEDTVRTLAWQTDLPLRRSPVLTETAYAANSDAPLACLDQEIRHALNTHKPTVICTHRPLIGHLFEHLRGICASPEVAGTLPSTSPFMPTGHAIALHVIDSPTGPSIIDIQKVTPIVY